MKVLQLVLVALGAFLAVRTAAALGPASTGVPVEQSSMAITFYNSGTCALAPPQSHACVVTGRDLPNGVCRSQVLQCRLAVLHGIWLDM